MSRRIAAEYSDEVSKLNKKEDLLLERKLKVFDRQEKVAQNTLKRSIHDVERFKLSLETEKRTPDLSVLERQRELTKASQYGIPSAGRTPREGYLFNKRQINVLEAKPQESRAVRLPPLNSGRNRKAMTLGQAVIPAPMTSLKSPRFKGKHRRVPEFALQLKTLEDIVKGSRGDGQNSKWQHLLGKGNHELSNGKSPVAPPSEKDSKTMTEDWVVASLKEARSGSPADVSNGNRLVKSNIVGSHCTVSNPSGNYLKDRLYPNGYALDSHIAYKSQIDEHKINYLPPKSNNKQESKTGSLTVYP